jgi:hypothetical protein
MSVKVIIVQLGRADEFDAGVVVSGQIRHLN